MKTGSVRGAGTDANVNLTIFGDTDNSGKRLLDNSENNFEKGKTDVFYIESLDLGELKKVRIEHDNAGFSAGWFLEEVLYT